MTAKQAWPAFWVLAIIWGSSYMFIRMVVTQIPPFQLVFIRTAIAAIGLNLVLLLRGRHLPLDGRSVRDLLFLGIVNTVFPFALITWGGQYIESSVSSVLQGTTALFSLVIAHFAFADERITVRKLAGLALGFAGVMLLASRGSGAHAISTNPNTANTNATYLLGQLAIIGSSLCYAIGGSYSRKAMQNRLEPMMASAGAMTVAAIITGLIAYGWPSLAGGPPADLAQLQPRVLVAILVLGLVNTFAAYLIFYSIVVALGASRSAMITYVIPVVGLVLGALFLAEPVDERLIGGAALILGGIAIVNLKIRR
jgi:drug/metabolite transporter (DMT)-like permease